MKSKKYNKVVNITKKKQIHRYREQTSGYQWRWGERGKIGMGRWSRGIIGVEKWEIQTIGYKIGSRMYCATWRL